MTTNNKEGKSPIEKYCEEYSYKLAQRIDVATALVIKPRPWWCPLWLYKKVIKSGVELVKVI